MVHCSECWGNFRNISSLQDHRCSAQIVAEFEEIEDELLADNSWENNWEFWERRREYEYAKRELDRVARKRAEWQQLHSHQDEQVNQPQSMLQEENFNQVLASTEPPSCESSMIEVLEEIKPALQDSFDQSKATVAPFTANTKKNMEQMWVTRQQFWKQCSTDTETIANTAKKRHSIVKALEHKEHEANCIMEAAQQASPVTVVEIITTIAFKTSAHGLVFLPNSYYDTGQRFYHPHAKEKKSDGRWPVHLVWELDSSLQFLVSYVGDSPQVTTPTDRRALDLRQILRRPQGANPIFGQSQLRHQHILGVVRRPPAVFSGDRRLRTSLLSTAGDCNTSDMKKGRIMKKKRSIEKESRTEKSEQIFEEKQQKVEEHVAQKGADGIYVIHSNYRGDCKIS